MAENKVTKNDVIKALQCCIKSTSDCDNCPLHIRGDGDCIDKAKQGALDIINQQRTEIERLKNECFCIANERDAYKEILDTAVTDAIKEFANKVKDNQRILFNYIYSNADFGAIIDNLVKEMVGEQE